MEPDRPSVLPPSARRLFETDHHATVVTINPDGSPQSSLVWIALDGDELVFGAERHRLKIRNLLRDPRVSVLIQDVRAHRSGLLQYLTVRGTATVIGPGIPDRFTELMDGLSTRYLGIDRFPFPNRGSHTGVIVRIRPERVGGLGPWADWL